jgi:legumain
LIMVKLITVVFFLLSIIGFNDATENDDAQLHAVIISTAQGCGSVCGMNYAMEKNAAHAYHSLINHGVPAENIILFMNTVLENDSWCVPEPGHIWQGRHHEKDLYTGLKIDYSGNSVTKSNFLAVLKGNESGIIAGNGRVLKSGPNDRVFIFLNGHGNTGFVGIASSGGLDVKELNASLTYMQEKKMFKELVFFMDSCNAGSMFDGHLDPNGNIYAVTAANASQAAIITGCIPFMHGKRSFCDSTSFGIGWLNNLDYKDLNNETMGQQYLDIKAYVKGSNVSQYGNLHIADRLASQFQGSKNVSQINFKYQPPKDSFELPLSQMAEYLLLKKQLEMNPEFVNDSEFMFRLKGMEKEREDIKKIVSKVMASFQPAKFSMKLMIEHVPNRITQLDCHHNLIQILQGKCSKIMRSPFVNEFIAPMTNLCEHKVDEDKLMREIEKAC